AWVVGQITFGPNSQIKALWAIPANNPVPEADSEAEGPAGDLNGRAQDVAHKLVEQEFKELSAEFDNGLKSTLPPRLIHQLWDSAASNAGAFQRLARVQRTYDIVDVKVQFERGIVDVRVGFDAQKRICGLFVTRLPSP